MSVEVTTKLAHAIGVARTQLDDLKKAKVAQEVITEIHRVNSAKQAVELTEWITLVESKTSTASKGKMEEQKETFRTEFDKLTESLLYTINNTTDQLVVEARNALLDYGKSYQEVVGVTQTEREDWRQLIIVSPLITDNSILAVYRGGWSDGSKKDRNQYSNGRLVPQAKSTGFKLAQLAPVYHQAILDDLDDVVTCQDKIPTKLKRFKRQRQVNNK